LGSVRYNNELDQFEGFGAGNTWGSLGGVIDIDQNTKITAEENTNDNNQLRFYTAENSAAKLQMIIMDNIDNKGCLVVGANSATDIVTHGTKKIYDGSLNIPDHGLHVEGNIHTQSDLTVNGRIGVGLSVDYDTIFNDYAKHGLVVNDVCGVLFVAENNNHDIFGDGTIALDISSTNALRIPVGSTLNRPCQNSGNNYYLGSVRYNNELDQFEGFGAGNTWGSLGGVIDIDQNTKITAEENTNDNNQLKFYTADENDTAKIQMIIMDNSYNNGCLVIGANSASDVVTNGTKEAYSGSLNIPDHVLHVEGDIHTSGNYVFDNSGTIQTYNNTTKTHTNAITIDGSGVKIYDSLHVDGNTILGDVSSDLITLKGSIHTNIVPDSTTNYRNIGSDTHRFQNMYLSNMLNIEEYDNSNNVYLLSKYSSGASSSDAATTSIAQENDAGIIFSNRDDSSIDVSMGFIIAPQTNAGLGLRMFYGQTNETCTIGVNNGNPSHLYAMDISGSVQISGNAEAAKFIATSDIRLKENVESITNALSKVGDLRGVYYNFKNSKKREIGVIAQEVEPILPEIVFDSKAEKSYKSVAYGNMVGFLIECIKELKQEKDDLSKRVAKLEEIIHNK
jgi:hypothetical protein